MQSPLVNMTNPSSRRSELVRRLRALTLELLPVEVDPQSINEPTSRIITPQVIVAYRAAAGDLVEAVSLYTVPTVHIVLLIISYVATNSFHTVC
jgi:hypothetical protein